MTARLSAIALLLAVLPTLSFGQTSEQYGVMGQKLWAAFQCGALAEHAGRAEESRRLYKIGYDQGTAFVGAYKAGKVDQQARNNVPLAVLLMLDGGPTVDFILGRIFESAMQDTSKHFTGGDSTKQKLIAEQSFTNQNCGLL